MIINSIKSLFTYTNKETLDLLHSPSVDDIGLFTDYHNFINSVLVIYGNQKSDGSIPVFWTRIANTETLEREADPNSTLKELNYNNSYYIHVIEDKLPVKIPQQLDSSSFLQNNLLVDNCSDGFCDSTLSILSQDHRNIELNTTTGHTYNINIPISGLLPNKNYTYIIEPIYSNWPNKLTQSSGIILRNSPLNQYGVIESSIDTKFLYLYRDGLNNLNNSLPYYEINISKPNYNKNIFSLFSIKIYDDANNLKLLDTINILCDTCVPTPTIALSPTPTPTSTTTLTPTVTPTISLTPSITPSIGSDPTPTPTITVTSSTTPTPTPSPTPDEPNRKCPYIDIQDSNIVLTNKNYTTINANFFYLNPNKNQAFEFVANEANWPSLISPIKDRIVNYKTYTEEGITYASGTINAILTFNNSQTNTSNLYYNIPKYKDEEFFDSRKFVNLKIKIGTYFTDLGFNIRLEENGRCSISSDNINVLCSGCVSNDSIKDCIESTHININNSTLDYPELSDSSNPGAEILLEKTCCNNNNVISAKISGLCPNNSYLYEWSSIPTIGISPVSGILNSNNIITNINSLYNLNYNGISNQTTSLKLKITDLTTNRYIEDNILIRCNDGCYYPTATPTQTITVTPTITPSVGSSPTPTRTPTVTPTRSSTILPPLTFDDFMLIFIDESSTYSASAGQPTSQWTQDLSTFNLLNNNQFIDINKMLIFHVRGKYCQRQLIFPSVNNNNFGMPIPLSRVIDTPRNDPSCVIDGQSLTGAWINNKVNSLIGNINPLQSRVRIFIDSSGSMTKASINPAITQYENILTQSNINWTEFSCTSEAWLRWITNIYSGKAVCS
jgi:hypothetical protein